MLDPTPVPGVPPVRAAGLGGLEDVALHPRFAENHFIYLTYIKPVDANRGTPAVARGRFEHGALIDVKDLVVTDPGPVGSSAVNSRIAFGRDGMLYISTGGNIENVAQDPASLRGKILRVRDDGSVPDDNPFVGRAGYRPEIYTLGHRNSLALIVHPDDRRTVEQRERPERRRRDQSDPRRAQLRLADRQLRPRLSGTADLRASHAGRLRVAAGHLDSVNRGIRHGGLHRGAVRPVEGQRLRRVDAGRRDSRTGHLQRIVFNAKMEEIRRESMLTELRQRIREVRQGPDGLIYLLTDEDPGGALLVLEPNP